MNTKNMTAMEIAEKFVTTNKNHRGDEIASVGTVYVGTLPTPAERLRNEIAKLVEQIRAEK